MEARLLSNYGRLILNAIHREHYYHLEHDENCTHLLQSTESKN